MNDTTQWLKNHIQFLEGRHSFLIFGWLKRENAIKISCYKNILDQLLTVEFQIPGLPRTIIGSPYSQMSADEIMAHLAHKLEMKDKMLALVEVDVSDEYPDDFMIVPECSYSDFGNLIGREQTSIVYYGAK